MFFRIIYTRDFENWQYTCDVPNYDIADNLYSQLRAIPDLTLIWLYRVDPTLKTVLVKSDSNIPPDDDLPF